ncbi:MAG TPA: protein-L-isoaspartate(D-aspartate) O-methyltransferase [Gemmatimonas sp.]|nr:protein-L-isoaspartate(D-aspartate) O-methyltransferase [Gemmatimonas sp.]
MRRRLVESLQDKGIRDLAVLRAIDQVPRHLFVPPDVRHRAYEDSALPIGSGQTISQPYVHARAIEQLMLTGREKVLEIGTGSAYQTALLSQLADQVFSIERYAALLDRARTLLSQAQVRNVSVSLGDGTLGWREYAPYDAIVVSAGAPHVPPALESQLAEGGRLLIPIGDRDEQMLTLFVKRGDRMDRRDIVPVRFVPLIGAGGWPA